MNNKLKSNRPIPATADELETLYFDFLNAFYGDGDRKKSKIIAARLEESLAARPDYGESIRSCEIRSLIAELRGDLDRAVQSREAEIRKIFELHSMSVNTPNWEYVSSFYHYGDISDRLDLLALLYDQLGDLDRAIAVLEESKLFCKAHKIPFDGQDILDEFEEARRKQTTRRVTATKKRRPRTKPRLVSVKRRSKTAGNSRRSA